MIDANDFLQFLGSNIRAVRAKRKVTRADLGKCVGLSVHRVTQLEMGKLDPDILTVHRIARALRIPAVDLFKTEIEMKDTRWGKPPYM